MEGVNVIAITPTRGEALFGGTSHIAPPDMNSYIKNYELILQVTYEFIHRYEFIH